MEELHSALQNCNAQVFWGEMTPSDHVVQIYNSDDVFLDALEEFVMCGIKSNDCVIVIATIKHLKSLENRMQLKGLNVDALTDDEQFIPLSAEIALGKFMRNGQPDETLFKLFVTQLLTKANKKNRKIKAFGEMVAILWAGGQTEATVKLEGLWNNFCKTEAFLLFCAYPKRGTTEDQFCSFENICQVHTKVIDDWNKLEEKVYYKDAV